MTPVLEKPTLHTVLVALERERLYDLGRVFGASLRESREKKERLATTLRKAIADERLPDVLSELGREELRAVSRAHGLPATATHRAELIEALLEAAGMDAAASVRPRPPSTAGVPAPGQILAARGRQWLVEEAIGGGETGSPLLRLACLDDDAPGKKLELLWDLEVGANVVDPRASPLGRPERLDGPAEFGAYLHALKWSSVSAADANLFQAPFRAGIRIMPHQLTPLMKALELPRANLFIADDVGLGKTIEAGLVLQELTLRQQAGFVLVVCPASVTLQWRDEMMRRFGLRFEVMSRAFLQQRRQERGAGVNPWATFHRFIVSYPLLRRSDYRQPLLNFLGERAEKGLLILDEAHVAAPASASKYAVDSETTIAVRELAPRFDNRLFLSATPHNGHSNSFSALLEILDPIRFQRLHPVTDPSRLEPVMVRRLKSDLKRSGLEKIPERILCRVKLEHAGDRWSATEARYSTETRTTSSESLLADDLPGDDGELEMARRLARYTELCAPERGAGRFPFINLQKRLLSSPEAFARTIEVHAATVERSGGVAARAAVRSRNLELPLDPETYGESDETLESEELNAMAVASRALPTPTDEAKALLSSLRALADRARRRPDAKTLALFAWLRRNCCPGLGLPYATKSERAWTDRRVILFTEYADTKRYLVELLGEAMRETERGDERLLQFHGGMGDDQRDEVQRAFNAPPADHPARILVATDAAREGVNLQGQCADLFHIDIPWNPSRLEQRNGRIDRILQQSPEVRCHYFVYAERVEDRVLETLLRKIDTVQSELGSMGAVLLDEMSATLEGGLRADTSERLESVGKDGRTEVAERELEALRKQKDHLQKENLRAGRLLEESKRLLQIEPESLRGVVEIGLAFAGAGPLEPAAPTPDGKPAYRLPPLDRSWDATLDTLRPARGRLESFWEWRQRPPRPITFHPLHALVSDTEQLHLSHPFVKRILDRFSAQGFGAHDLSRRATVVVPGESVPRLVAYARLTLFGPGAARLHDELVAIVADWTPGEKPGAPLPEKDAARVRDAVERALSARSSAAGPAIVERALADAEAAFAALWPSLEAEADSRGVEAKNGLARRARKESEELKKLLLRQRAETETDLATLKQLTLEQLHDKTQRRQAENDLKATEDRRALFERQLDEEPAKIERLYEVQRSRLVPVGLVFAWPEALV